jgi:hypothetical protein
LSVESLGKWCEQGLEEADCSLADLRVMIMQEAPAREEPGAVVMDSRARGSTDEQMSGPYRKLKAFWVKERQETRRFDFMGWDCEAAQDPPPGKRCFSPASAEERRTPSKFGYQRFVQLTACSGKGTNCRIFFPYRGRFIEVEPQKTPMNAQSEEATGHLFLAAWEFLNRLAADTRNPPSASTHLARAAASLANCRAITAQAEKAGDRNRRNQLGGYARWHCAIAAQFARLALREKPAEAGSLIAAALTASASQRGSRSSRALLEEAVAALRASDKRESQAMAEAQLALAMQLPFGGATPDSDARRAALAEALRVADAALPADSGTHVAIYREIAASVAADKEPAKVEWMERWQAAMRRAHGDADPLAIEAMSAYCFALRDARQLERLRECADALLPGWLEAVAKQVDSPWPNDLLVRGTSLHGWYAGYGLSQDKPLEVLPTMRKIAAIVQPQMPGSWATYNAPSLKLVEDRARVSGARPAR